MSPKKKTTVRVVCLLIAVFMVVGLFSTIVLSFAA